MKKLLRKLSLLLAVATIVAVTALPALAVEPRNSTDEKYSFNVVPKSDFVRTYPRNKENKSKIFTRVDTMKDKFVRVAAFSVATDAGVPANLTYYGQGLVTYVCCNKGINYGISPMIYEYYLKYPNMYGHSAALGFQSALSYSDAISGWWSPDSTREHNTPFQ